MEGFETLSNKNLEIQVSNNILHSNSKHSGCYVDLSSFDNLSDAAEDRPATVLCLVARFWSTWRFDEFGYAN